MLEQKIMQTQTNAWWVLEVQNIVSCYFRWWYTLGAREFSCVVCGFGQPRKPLDSALIIPSQSQQGFWYFARSWSHEIQVNQLNSAKFTKTRKILWNSVEILSNTFLYSNFETCLSYWGYLLAVNSQIYVKTSSLKRANNIPKLPGIDYVAKKLGTSHDVKDFAIGSFLERVVVERANDVVCEKNIKNAGLISAKPINFLWNLPWK